MLKIKTRETVLTIFPHIVKMFPIDNVIILIRQTKVKICISIYNSIPFIHSY